MFKDQVFSKADFEGKAKGGIFFRSFDLAKFLEKIEAKCYLFQKRKLLL